MFLVTFSGYDEAEEVTIGMIRYEGRRKRKRDSRERDRKRRRSRSRGGRRRRSDSRERDRGDRDRDRTSRERDRRSKDRDRRSNEGGRRGKTDGKLDDYPNELTNEVLDKIIKERESRAAHAVGRNYARPPIGLKRGLSVKSETATIRARSRSPEDVPRRRRRPVHNRAAAPKKKAQPSEEHMIRMAQLMKKYGHDPTSVSTQM